jgi:Zn-dependent protease with chaperone function
MTYLFHLVVLAFGAFFLVYVALSIALAAAWPLLKKRGEGWEASVLFTLRIVPLLVAVAVVGLLIVPSFLYLEPFGTGEALQSLGLTLAFGGITVISAGAILALLASRRATRFVAAYPRIRTVEVAGSNTTALAVAAPTPMLMVAGVCQPKLLISEEASRLLEPDEMQAAIRHELAHITCHDNLKKLVLRLIQFPFLHGLEQTWKRAAELAADDAAATNELAAVYLASALLKVASRASSRLPELTMSLLPDEAHTLRLRIDRLLAWKPRSEGRSSRSVLWTSFALLGLLLLTLGYGPLLGQVHELTELLFR